ncbi:hypothetical protein DRW41_22395 [Neobacillus piezotolerans]|uniref:NADH-quinone oxidoreductase subunit H n=2 Tax=Bacteria TaxID=2 RepID=A0A2I0QYN6_9FLAO|nr:hypothetical protein CW751_15095 [Brumimicrobium salinarum]RDU34646.1 hypothetical protein DRW41_22395 [Neobacillus piezotolerans]
MDLESFKLFITTIFNILITIIAILLSVAFYTILERKFLSYIQIRKGPNKVRFIGILQPFRDAIKLFNKTITLPTTRNTTLIIATPLFTFFLGLII